MPTKTAKTPEQKAAEAETAARERRGQLEDEGTFVSPTRAEPPLMDEDPSQLERLEEEAEAEMADEHTWEQAIESFRAAVVEPGLRPKGLHAKIAEVIQEVQYIQKTGTAPRAMGGYTFVEAGEIAKVLRMALAKRGVTMLPSHVEQVGDILVQPTRNGGVLNIQTIKTRWILTDSETGEWAFIESMGTGGDSGDKFSPKAQTNSMKYALQVGFLLETGDDPEKTELPEAVIDGAGPAGIQINPSNVEGVRQGGRQNMATQAQLDTILRNAKEANLSPEAFAALIGASLGGNMPDLSEVEPDEQRPVIRAFLGALNFEDAGTIVRATSDLFPSMDPA